MRSNKTKLIKPHPKCIAGLIVKQTLPPSLLWLANVIASFSWASYQDLRDSVCTPQSCIQHLHIFCVNTNITLPGKVKVCMYRNTWLIWTIDKQQPPYTVKWKSSSTHSCICCFILFEQRSAHTQNYEVNLVWVVILSWLRRVFTCCTVYAVIFFSCNCLKEISEHYWIKCN